MPAVMPTMLPMSEMKMMVTESRPLILNQQSVTTYGILTLEKNAKVSLDKGNASLRVQRLISEDGQGVIQVGKGAHLMMTITQGATGMVRTDVSGHLTIRTAIGVMQIEPSNGELVSRLIQLD